MKPLWTQTLVWIATVLAAFLLALATPDGAGVTFDAFTTPGIPR